MSEDVIVQLAEYLAEKAGLELGAELFYYSMPSEVDQCVVVQRTRSNRTVLPVIDAGMHAVRVAARSVSSTTAYAMAKLIYDTMDVTDDEFIDDAPGFIELAETPAYVTLYDSPQFCDQDQQGRKVFEFYALLTTKR